MCRGQVVPACTCSTPASCCVFCAEMSSRLSKLRPSSPHRHRACTACSVRERSIHPGFDVLEQHLHLHAVAVFKCASRLLQGIRMGSNKFLTLLCLTAAAFSSSWAAAPSADDLISTSCSVALDVFSQCSSAAKGVNLDAACCTPYSVLKTFDCFWYVQTSLLLLFNTVVFATALLLHIQRHA